jgi:DNA polymerase III delta subunit
VYADGVTCGKLAAYCTLDMARIAKETEKLLCYCVAKGEERLSDEIVDMLVSPDFEYKTYELADAISRKNYSSYLKIMADLSTKGFNETSLLSSICSHFKGLYEISLMRGSDKEIAAVLGIKEYAAKKKREQAAKFKGNYLFETYHAVFNALSDIKCGKITPPSALKRVTAELFFKNA